MILDHAFQINPNDVSSGKFTLSESESFHAIRVLRLKKNDKIWLLDGVGNGYHAKIEDLKSNGLSGQIIKHFPDYGENTHSIHLGMALIKRSRFELVLEKATELGVREITPIITDRCTKKNLNLDRSKKIIIEASKQCRRSRFPVLQKPIKLINYCSSKVGQILVGVTASSNKLRDVSSAINKTVHVIIGPEGDFSDNELNIMKNNNVINYNLGQRRLRSETAALYSISFLNEVLR